MVTFKRMHEGNTRLMLSCQNGKCDTESRPWSLQCGAVAEKAAAPAAAPSALRFALKRSLLSEERLGPRLKNVSDDEDAFLLPGASEAAAAEEGDLSLVGVADRRFFNMVRPSLPSNHFCFLPDHISS